MKKSSAVRLAKKSAFLLGLERMLPRLSQEAELGVLLLGILRSNQKQILSLNSINSLRQTSTSPLPPAIANVLLQSQTSLDQPLLLKCLESCSDLPSSFSLNTNDPLASRVLLSNPKIVQHPKIAEICLQLVSTYPEQAVRMINDNFPNLSSEILLKSFKSSSSHHHWEQIRMSDSALQRIVDCCFQEGNFEFLALLERAKPSQRDILVEEMRASFARNPLVGLDARLFLLQMHKIPLEGSEHPKLIRDASLPGTRKETVLHILEEEFASEAEILHELEMMPKFLHKLTSQETESVLRHLYLDSQSTPIVWNRVESILGPLKEVQEGVYYNYLQLENGTPALNRWNAFVSFFTPVPSLSISEAIEVWEKLEHTGYPLSDANESWVFQLFRIAVQSDNKEEMDKWIAKSTFSRLNTLALVAVFSEQQKEVLSGKWTFVTRLFKPDSLKIDDSVKADYIRTYCYTMVNKTPVGHLDNYFWTLLHLGSLLPASNVLANWLPNPTLYLHLIDALEQHKLEVPDSLSPSESKLKYAWDQEQMFIESPTGRELGDRLLFNVFLEVMFKSHIKDHPATLSKDLPRILSSRLKSNTPVCAFMLNHYCDAVFLLLNDNKGEAAKLWEIEGLAKLPLATLLIGGGKETRSFYQMLPLVDHLMAHKESLSESGVNSLQQFLHLLMDPNEDRNHVFDHMAALQALKKNVSRVDLKFVLKSIAFLPLCEESHSVQRTLVYLNQNFKSLLNRNPNQLLVEPLFDRMTDTVLSKLKRDFPRFDPDLPTFYTAVGQSFELISKVLEFSTDNVPGYQFKIFEQMELFPLLLLLLKRKDFPLEIYRQLFVTLQNLCAFEGRITGQICERYPELIVELNLALTRPEIKGGSEQLAFVVVNAYFAFVHANPTAFTEAVGKQGLIQLETKLQAILQAFAAESELTWEEFEKKDLYLVLEEFKLFLRRLNRREFKNKT